MYSLGGPSTLVHEAVGRSEDVPGADDGSSTAGLLTPAVLC